MGSDVKKPVKNVIVGGGTAGRTAAALSHRYEKPAQDIYTG